MKKKIWIPIAVVVLLAVLFVPIPHGQMDDGGSKEWCALTYRVVKWNRLVSEEETYSKTRVYFGADCFKSIDELWEKEKVNLGQTPAGTVNEPVSTGDLNEEKSFAATVLQISGTTVTVTPMPNEAESKSCDKITFSFKNMYIGAKKGDAVRITYKGGIMETYPAQINAVGLELLSGDFRDTAYGGDWMDMEDDEKLVGSQDSDHFTITQIYSDCFFARSFTDPQLKGVYKINGSISEDWCVGDLVYVIYDKGYGDNGGEHGVRVECELNEIGESKLDPNAVYDKPVIYLYPEKETEVSVKLDLDGKLTCTYPKYGDGWTVTASPDGTLTDADGQVYNYLYWEGVVNTQWDMSKGYCVKGEDTAEFLEDALDKLGLTRREANEFIVYWLPLMQDNPYNIISFQTDAYAESAALDIAPAPDTLIRVFMAYKASDTAVDIEPQELFAPERKGFVAVEWGGSEIK